MFLAEFISKGKVKMRKEVFQLDLGAVWKGFCSESQGFSPTFLDSGFKICPILLFSYC